MYQDESFRHVLIDKLMEREKELLCLYNIIELLKDRKSDLEQVLKKVAATIPKGWQFSTICEVKICIGETIVTSTDFKETEWMQKAEIISDHNVVGFIEIAYTQFIRSHHNSQFLPEEQQLLNTIADRLGNYVFYNQLKRTVEAFQKKNKQSDTSKENSFLSTQHDEHWKWRKNVALQIAKKLDKDYYGVKGLYLIGSTKNANAGPCSDIDFIIHFCGNEKIKKELKAWFSGWSHALAYYNFNKTGYLSEEGLIDLHFITDEDIQKKTSYAIMLDSSENPAFRLF